ncbi:MAG TPA: hypothetical protein VMY88_12255, partial [Acidimicrobiales bacterium]|nr:hypothetical protein [Acidimicrobiales bacterium]
MSLPHIHDGFTDDIEVAHHRGRSQPAAVIGGAFQSRLVAMSTLTIDKGTSETLTPVRNKAKEVRFSARRSCTSLMTSACRL